MKNIEIVFLLSDTEKIILEFEDPEMPGLIYEDPLDEIDCCYEGSIIFVKNNEQTLLSLDAIREEMYMLRVVLEKALQNRLQLHDSIKEDIGFMYNQYNYIFWSRGIIRPEGFVYETKEKSSWWVGEKYKLWLNNYASWIYNNVDGEIVFEITPFYPYLHGKRKQVENYISYKKWIKNYKPYLIKKITKEVAQKWCEWAIKIENHINANIERWRKEGRKN